MADETKSAAQLATHNQSEESLKTDSQRGINMMWETTQSRIAIMVAGATLVSIMYMIVMVPTAREGAFLVLTSLSSLVVGTYFQRTNHTKSSGSQNGERR